MVEEQSWKTNQGSIFREGKEQIGFVTIGIKASLQHLDLMDSPTYRYV